MIRFDQTPPPSPSWDRHLSTEARLMLELRGDLPRVVEHPDTGDSLHDMDTDDAIARLWDRPGAVTIEQRDTVDEADDGLEVME